MGTFTPCQQCLTCAICICLTLLSQGSGSGLMQDTASPADSLTSTAAATAGKALPPAVDEVPLPLTFYTHIDNSKV
jgi:hypothetical protein